MSRKAIHELAEGEKVKRRRGRGGFKGGCCGPGVPLVLAFFLAQNKQILNENDWI